MLCGGDKPRLDFNLYIHQRHAATGQDLPVIDKRQRLLPVGDFAFHQLQPTSATIAGAALVLHWYIVQFKHVEQAAFTFRAA